MKRWAGCTATLVSLLRNKACATKCWYQNFDTWAARRSFAISDSMRNTFSASEKWTCDSPLYKTALESRAGTKLPPSRNPFETYMNILGGSSDIWTATSGKQNLKNKIWTAKSEKQNLKSKIWKARGRRRGTGRGRGRGRCSNDFINTF
jgi:hypothetical protein